MMHGHLGLAITLASVAADDPIPVASRPSESQGPFIGSDSASDDMRHGSNCAVSDLHNTADDIQDYPRPRRSNSRTAPKPRISTPHKNPASGVPFSAWLDGGRADDAQRHRPCRSAAAWSSSSSQQPCIQKRPAHASHRRAPKTDEHPEEARAGVRERMWAYPLEKRAQEARPRGRRGEPGSRAERASGQGRARRLVVKPPGVSAGSNCREEESLGRVRSSDGGEVEV
ncbi:hypothetical protein C8Q73DRAFT_207446 [Cubamyces lactineus]|nr:hypothetical protein C8Q73DRAFT_207446 [Cubamyces lactineus]